MSALPPVFQKWFKSRGWQPRAHQLALLEKARAQQDALLIAPTGAGKTLAGFLPSLIDLAALDSAALKQRGLHTLYISPLKALAVDIARNLEVPHALGMVTVLVTSPDNDDGNLINDKLGRPPHELAYVQHVTGDLARFLSDISGGA